MPETTEIADAFELHQGPDPKDSGWYIVQWPNRSVTYFRDKERARALHYRLRGSAPVLLEHVRTLP